MGFIHDKTQPLRLLGALTPVLGEQEVTCRPPGTLSEHRSPRLDTQHLPLTGSGNDLRTLKGIILCRYVGIGIEDAIEAQPIGNVCRDMIISQGGGGALSL